MMGRQIKQPDLESTSPPFFDLSVGHLAKVLTSGEYDALWVKVIEIQGDRLMGIVSSGTAANRGRERGLREDDVIEFERRHIFGLY